ncbi:MAG TPA: 4Fe-4S dicluster domain-containing protein [Terracidiphilus sp.]|nr:4Fe-4S dicluster domain-containing protein [Terracidiphilus sp.]
MTILAMLLKNVCSGAVTLRFPARPSVTPRFRGLVRFDPSLCTGCAICKLRCTSRAITYTAGKGEFYWSYDPAQCTFCGRCVEGCIEHAHKEGRTEHALSQESACPPIYTTLGSLKKSYTIARKPPAARTAPARSTAAAPELGAVPGGAP